MTSFAFKTSEKGLFARLAARVDASDVLFAFFHTPSAILSSLVFALLVLLALAAPVLAPLNPFDLARIDVLDAHLPPVFCDGGDARFFFGTDDQGRDLLSTMLYGLRISLSISLISVALSIVIGVGVGLTSGFVGGALDAFLMRLCDVMLSFPAILTALLIDGVCRAIFPSTFHESLAFFVLVFAITLSGWVPYARTVRGLTLVEKGKEYVLASELTGLTKVSIMIRHILPNVLEPVYVLAAVNVATAVMTEATLSFLGVGVPPTTPSLGTLIRIGNDYLFSGEWWICIFPGLVLVALVLSVNLMGDWLRDAMNPKLH
ncbi:MAG: ABC transporter permease [Sutterella sp.]|nr:ABC transporter permease [Sutterella sp.]